MGVTIAREDVLGFRVRAQQLDRRNGPLSETAVFDAGVQDTRPDGGLWALAIRGVDVAALPGDELAGVWTIRGAPHLYRRADLPAVAKAVWPWSEADAGKRIFDAAKPLREAGIDALAALDVVASAMRSVVTEPLVKGEVSTRVSRMMDPPYLRFCRSCDATHLYELPFRLAALRAGLELQAGTSPPVLEPIPGFEPAARTPEQYDVVRTYLRLLGPATPKQLAEYLDSPIKEVKAHWPADAVDVTVDGETRSALSADMDALTAGPARTTQLLGPYDLYLQGRDRALLVSDAARAKVLWPVLGRPGGVLVDGEIAGTWRPRKVGKKLKVQIGMWTKDSARLRGAIAEEAERLAAYRGVPLADVDFTA
ncbi:winged helix DNA-binding domain-containing protein [Phytoactinopolyspora alkaliphila]|uniref:Winged helix DNA-binding domain-containing protein n=1 Tax=Phytoactinopolyspora alkaliphila TaxID=1783498 RepID=A0A6N9YNM3_9ACTN|nr:winged helix DNA-binding domain-containing protein [Phytoactinopolyspora alkaliphila]NED96572.1 winged helix DNA-binding domain-containing protein [Phytoactinopolyspora alkaliphila]